MSTACWSTGMPEVGDPLNATSQSVKAVLLANDGSDSLSFGVSVKSIIRIIHINIA